MKDLNIALGNGYKSVSGTGVKSIFVDEESVHTKKENIYKFAYTNNFYETNTEVHRELSTALGLSADLTQVSAEVKTSVDKSTDNNNQVRYYIINLTWQTVTESILLNKNKFVDLKLANVTTSLEQSEFYEKYGDSFISKVTYGQKLVVVIQINRSQFNKAAKFSLSQKSKIPLKAGVTISESIEINSLLKSLEDDSIANIEIFSIGNTNPNLQLEVLNNIQQLREVMQGFVDNRSNKPTIHTSPESKKESYHDDKTAKAALTTDTKIVPPVANTNNERVVIGFTKSSYSLIASERKESKEKIIAKNYDQILVATSKATKWLAAIAQCRARAERYCEDINYAFKNPEAFQLTTLTRETLSNTKRNLKITLSQLNHYENKVRNNIFDSNKYEAVWTKILKISKYLNSLSTTTISFKNSLFLVGNLISKYTPLARFFLTKSRVTPYSEIKVPFETEQLFFKVELLGSGSRTINANDIRFDLISKNSIHIDGHEHSHRALHKNLADGSSRLPIFMSSSDLIAHMVTGLSENEIAFLSNHFNKTYKRVAIGRVNTNEIFSVKIYIQTKLALESLRFTKKAPKGNVSYDSSSMIKEESDKKSIMRHVTPPRLITKAHTHGITTLSAPLTATPRGISVKGSKTPSTLSSPSTPIPPEVSVNCVLRNGKAISSVYWYEDNEIKKLCHIQLQQHNYLTQAEQAIYVLGPLDNISRYNLKRALVAHNQQDGLVIIPYNLGALHWVGLVLEYNQGNLIKADYYDSLNGKVPDLLNEYIHSLAKAEDTVKQFTAITDSRLIQQKNGVDCGPCMIGNLMNAVGYPEPANLEAIDRRFYHLEILERDAPEFYKNFYERQKYNQRSFPSLPIEFEHLHNYSTKECLALLALVQDIFKLPNKIQEGIKSVLTPNKELDSDEQNNYLTKLRQFFFEHRTNEQVMLIANQFFGFSEPEFGKMMRAELNIKYDQLIFLHDLLQYDPGNIKIIYNILKESIESDDKQAETLISAMSPSP